MATLRELKGRIGSVASSEKITGAMKMISSAKMRKAEADIRRLKPYRSQIETIIGNLLCADAVFSSPLTVITPVQNMAIAVFGSDDGLCGAYNVNTFKFLKDHIANLRSQFGLDLKIDILPVGRKMLKAVEKLADDNTVIVHDLGVDSKSDGDKIKNFNTMLQQKFVEGIYNRIDLIYMNFLSVSRQRPVADTMLPISANMFSKENAKVVTRPYIFEPSAADVFNTVLPMYVQALLTDVFCENRASEQAARVMAMQSANDNAKKLLEELRLEYNKLRQQGITSELLDIVGGQVKD